MTATTYDARDLSASYQAFMAGDRYVKDRDRAKAIGQFFTPEAVSDPLIDDLVLALPQRPGVLRAVDPFCGDGRLLRAFLVALSERGIEPGRVELAGWDIDPEAVAEARRSLEEAAADVPFPVQARCEVCDAFFRLDGYAEAFDVCVTNPPWSSTKSLKASSFSSRDHYLTYQSVANDYGRLLGELFPEARGIGAFGAGTTNLSRFGLALSLRLVKPDGALGIVMPASFLGDTGSGPLRRALMGRFNLASVRSYAAELRLFDGVDQGVVTLACRAPWSGEGRVEHRSLHGETRYGLTPRFLAYSEEHSCTVPVGFSEDEMRVVEKLGQCSTLGERRDIRLGREVDETRFQERLCPASDYRFIKGLMVWPYRIDAEPLWHFNDRLRGVPATADAEKVVWRDVSRASQAKRIKATLVGPGHVAGNSLGVSTADDPALLRAFLAVLNSSAWEFVAETVLTTNHVSASALRRLPFPELAPRDLERLAAGAEGLLSRPDDAELQAAVDWDVSQALGLTPEEHQTILRRLRARGDAKRRDP